MTIIDGHNFTQLTNLNVLDNLYLEGAALPDVATAPLVLNSSFDPDVAPLTLISGSDEDDYTQVNAALVMQDAAGDEIWRIWAMDPDDASDDPDNLFIGAGAGENIDPSGFQGTANTACGGETQTALDTGFRNTAFGDKSQKTVTDGSVNSGFGVASLEALTTADKNDAFGRITLLSLTNGTLNIALGEGALAASVAGDSDVAVGSAALTNSTDGFNVAIGYLAGNQILTSEDTIVIGAGFGVPSQTADDQLNIGGAIHGDMTSGDEAIIIELQTSDPQSLGVLWNDSGTLMVSAG